MQNTPTSGLRTAANDYVTIVQPASNKVTGLLQLRTLGAVKSCCTASLGSHLDCCTDCGYVHISYNSCRNRALSQMPASRPGKVDTFKLKKEVGQHHRNGGSTCSEFYNGRKKKIIGSVFYY